MNHFFAVVLRTDGTWNRVRKENIAGCCALCDHEGQLELHHIVPWNDDPSSRYDPENLVTLCRPCHFRFGHWCNWRTSNPHILDLCRHVRGMRNSGLASAT